MKLVLGLMLAALRLQPYARVEATSVAPSSPCICQADYSPVCGTDGNTYFNECSLRCASAENVRNGGRAIRVYRPGRCPPASCPCPAVYQPVCGVNGKTYGNACVLACENSRRAKLFLPPIRTISNSECPTLKCSCSNTVAPVCGNNGVSYRNICFLQEASRENQEQQLPPIRFSSNGTCPRETCGCSGTKSVCANNGKTYGSKCALQCENRVLYALGKPSLTIVNDGPCGACSCTSENNPICGSDGKTYINPCYLKCENAARARDGRPLIKSSQKGVCGCSCKEYFDPVCGSDNRNYKNICQLHCESVRRERAGLGRIWLAYGGPCVCDCSGCDTTYAPVCGSDGRTYWNLCWLECYSACNQRRNEPSVQNLGPGYC